MADLKRYRAVEGGGLVSHPTIKTYVGWRRVVDKSEQPGDLVVPDGHRWRRMPDGDVLPDSAYLRKAVRQGALEELPLELVPVIKSKNAPKGAGSEV